LKTRPTQINKSGDWSSRLPISECKGVASFSTAIPPHSGIWLS
jgi:hypothetical protein